MEVPEYQDVDLRTLRLASTRVTGADPGKLQRQIARHGTATQGMPPLFVYRARDGEFAIADGVTRATRAAKLRPGDLVRVEVIGGIPTPGGQSPLVGDRLR